jgi:hypothetical protein
LICDSGIVYIINMNDLPHIFPVEQNGLIVKFFYAIIITVVVVVVTMYFIRMLRNKN